LETSIEEFEKWLANPEAHNLEFKAARSSFDSNNDLPKYCAGIANSGGGKLILGVDDERQVVGSQAFQNNTNSLSQDLFQQIAHHVEVEELLRPQGRVVIFHILQRRIGIPVSFKGRYFLRRGSSLVEMDQQTLRSVLNEIEPDFSAQIVAGLTFDDLDQTALNAFRLKWANKAKRPDFNDVDFSQMLRDFELSTPAGITYAALILVGSSPALRCMLPDSEIIFEWRHDQEQIHHDARKTWRGPYVLISDEVAKEVELRNWRVPLQDGMFQRDLYAYDEKSIREAVNNAVAHRVYTLTGRSVFIKLSTGEFLIESPGGFPEGVTAENILDLTAPRNRLLAETMNQIGLVERSGQGLNDIFKRNITASKAIPEIWEVDRYWVRLKIPALIQDVEFVKFIEKVTSERQISFTLAELMELELVRRTGNLPGPIASKRLLEYGLVEKINLGRASRYVLSHRYYADSQKTGNYTRLVGLSRLQKKQLILNHLTKNKRASTQQVSSVFPELKAKDISNLLQELRREGKISFTGKLRSGFWTLTNEGEG